MIYNFSSIKYFKFLFSVLLISTVTSCKTETIEPDEIDSDYITDVYDYVYAPGQHAQLAKAEDIQYFKGNPEKHSKWLYLGGFGGYIIAGFNHDVINGEGADFEVYALKGSSPEPAIVYVMPDSNNDNKPNDIWYELIGNQHENSKRNYWVKYMKPSSENANISWLDSDGKTGELIPGFNSTFSAVWWWPATSTESITFNGTRLIDVYSNVGTSTEQHWVVPTDLFTWGYAENNTGTDFISSTAANQLDISNAIDSSGKSVNLASIRFIKVQTAVFQQAGWTNEVSSEVRGAKDLRKK